MKVIKGQVLFVDTKLPIENARVSIENTENFTNTDENGFFEIEISGIQTLVFQHKGTNQVLKIEVQEKMDSDYIKPVYMMNEISSIQTNECDCNQTPLTPQKTNSGKKVFLGFLAGFVLGSLVSKSGKKSALNVPVQVKL